MYVGRGVKAREPHHEFVKHASSRVVDFMVVYVTWKKNGFHTKPEMNKLGFVPAAILR